MTFPASKSASLLACGIIVLAAFTAYHNSFSGPFVLDDSSSIAGNPTIRHLWPLSIPLSPPHGEGQTVEGRPIVNLSLAVNYAISGTAVWSYHALNLLIHILAGLTLFGIVRRTLRWSALSPTRLPGDGADQRAGDPPSPGFDGLRNALQLDLLALAVSLLWTLHPLQTESVTYVVQRAESLMGLFYLLTLYCFIRAVPSSLAGRESLLWFGLSWLGCLFGMATKEAMVSAPLIVLLYDRTFLAGSFRAAWQNRRGVYLALAATWIPLASLVQRTGSRGGTSGPGSGVGAWTYWRTQFPAVVHYLHLALWPHPLVFDYGVEWEQSPLILWLSVALVLGLVAVTGYALVRPSAKPGSPRWRALGFLGFWFFAILAPTSLVPGNRQTMAEHRMYLALIPVLALGVIGLEALVRHCRPGRWPGIRAGGSARPPPPPATRHGAIAFAAIILPLAIVCALLTARRNRDYRSLFSLYADTVDKRPGNAFAQNNLGVALLSLGRAPEAIGHDEEAIRLRPGYATAHDNLGNALLHVGRTPEAVVQFEEALRLKPDFEEAHHNLGTALVSLGRLSEAVAQFETALRLDPTSAETHNNLGNALFRLGQPSEAIVHYREALRLAPAYVEADDDLGNALSAEGKGAEAVACFEAALRLDPGNAQTHYNFGNALLGMSRLTEAMAQFRTAIQLQPDYASAHDNLGNALLRLDRVSEAAAQYEETLRLQPDHAVARYNLGNALLRLGRGPEAVVQFREALRLQPDFPQARQMLNRLAPAR